MIDRKAFRAAFPHTVPVMAGYIFLGIAFGLLVRTKGYPAWWPVVMSLVIFSGSQEFAAIPLLGAAFDPVGSFFLGLMISARHLFYGIPMLEKYRESGAYRIPLRLMLTDETFSIVSTVNVPSDVNSIKFYWYVSVLDYVYWNLGTAIGCFFGSFTGFDLTGIDFVLTALFIVLLVEQMGTKEGRISGFVGLAASTVALIAAGSSLMVVVSMGVILLSLLGIRRCIDE